MPSFDSGSLGRWCRAGGRRHPAVLETAVEHADNDELIKPKAYVVVKDGHAGSYKLRQ